MILSVIKCLTIAAAAILASIACLVWLGFGYTASIVLFATDEPLAAIIALVVGSAPTAAVLVVGWLMYRSRRFPC